MPFAGVSAAFPLLFAGVPLPFYCLSTFFPLSFNFRSLTASGGRWLLEEAETYGDVEEAEQYFVCALRLLG